MLTIRSPFVPEHLLAGQDVAIHHWLLRGCQGTECRDTFRRTLLRRTAGRWLEECISNEDSLDDCFEFTVFLILIHFVGPEYGFHFNSEWVGGCIGIFAMELFDFVQSGIELGEFIRWVGRFGDELLLSPTSSKNDNV